VVLDTHGGFGLYLGQLQARGVTIDEAVKIVGYHHADILSGSLPGGARGEIEADRSAGERALQMIRGDPAAFATAALSNIRGLWLGLDFNDLAGPGGMRVLMTLAAGAAYLPVLALGLLGIGLSGRTGRREIFWACVVLLATTTLLHAVVLGGKRYRTVTIDPVLMVAAACQAARFLARFWPEPLAGPHPAKAAAG